LLVSALLLTNFKPKVSEVPKNNTQNNIQSQNNTPKVFLSKYPVVLVHGWLGKAVDFGPYGLKLQEDGIAEYKGELNRYDNLSLCPEQWPKSIVVSAEYYYDFNRNQGIPEYASELKPIIQLVKNCTGSEQVILIGHSMGGLVSRKYMIDYGNASVNELITLATPHYGFNEFTRPEIIFMMLDFFTGRRKEIDQMRPESEFLKELDKDDADYREQVISIGTYNLGNKTNIFGLRVFSSQIDDFEKQHFDNTDLVVSLDSTKLAGSKYYQVEGCSHTEILNFKAIYPKGPINNPNTCKDAYEIVKKEILEAS
jgi:pimeloyl-ACP methyl ester carboxylesterase